LISQQGSHGCCSKILRQNDVFIINFSRAFKKQIGKLLESIQVIFESYAKNIILAMARIEEVVEGVTDILPQLIVDLIENLVLFSSDNTQKYIQASSHKYIGKSVELEGNVKFFKFINRNPC
jgi:hypothetical protein